MTRRTEQDIIAEILRIAKNGAIKTHIIYRANLNTDMAKAYLPRLMGRGLLRLREPRYFTTDKGVLFVWHYEAMMEQTDDETRIY